MPFDEYYLYIYGMKNLIITLIISAFCLSAGAQSFEGKVVYNAAYKSKIAAVSDDQFTSLLGSTLNYYLKGGDYRADGNGTLMIWQIYINSDNKLYNKLGNSNTVFWENGSVNKDSVLSAQLNKNAANVLGYQCDELILNCKSGLQKYYYTSKFPIDSKLFEKHLTQNWYDYLKRANAMPLKMVLDNTQATITMTATSITPEKLDSSLFQLPAGTQTQELPNQ